MTAVPGYSISMTVAVFFTEPDELFAVRGKVHALDDFDPSVVAILVDGYDVAGRRVRKQHVVRVLEAVQMLKDEMVVIGPLHASHVSVARIAGHFHPCHLSARRTHDSDPHGRVRRSRFRIGNAEQGRVELVGVINDGELADTFGVKVPKGDALAVGAPAKAVAKPELFFVNPVGSPKDRCGRAAFGQRRDRAGFGQRRDRAGRQSLDVQVVRHDIGDARSVGRELGEHERRGWSHAAELSQSAARDVQDPVIAARVPPPNTDGVRKDEQPCSIGRPRVIVDLEWTGRVRGPERARRNEHLSCAGFGVVADDVVRVLHGFRRLDRRVGVAVRQPFRRTEALGVEVFAVEDPLQLISKRRRHLAVERC